MGYYTRVFCQAERSPALSEVRAYLDSFDAGYRLEGEADDEDNEWTNFELFYKDGRHPIPVELNWCDEEGSLGEDELMEVVDQIGSPGLSLKKRKVIAHLKKTRFIVCNQLLSDLDEEGFMANDRISQFFVVRYTGMMHADNEGFYGRDGGLLLRDE